MTDELNISLADLDVQDDLDVAMDNDTYQDQVNPAPPVAGNYVSKALKLVPAKTKEGKPVFENNDKRFPILRLQQLEILEGLEGDKTRKVSVFQDIKTKPYDRYGTPASNLGDITRAYGTDSWQGIPDGLAKLQEAAQLSTFAHQLDWEVQDREFVEAAFQQLNVPTDKSQRTEDQKKLVGAIYKASRITGMGKFPYDAQKGRFIHVLQRENVTFQNPVTGANVTIEVPHRALEARPVITRYFPKADVEGGRVKIGPLNVKPAKAVANIG